MESATITTQSGFNKNIEEAVEQLFTKGTVTALHIRDCLSWAYSKPSRYKKDLAMPLIQRGFVWKTGQLQKLWDSLLRGMPIGAVMVGQQAEVLNVELIESADLIRLKLQYPLKHGELERFLMPRWALS